LEEYNVEFASKAAAATGLMHELQVKDVYIGGLSNTKMREQLAAHLEKSLPVLQAKAMDLAHVYDQGPRAGSNIAATKPNHQNPSRVQCDKCNWWYDTTKGGRCRCQRPVERPTPNRTAFKPRVQEALMTVQEAEQSYPAPYSEFDENEHYTAPTNELDHF
jgi:hypothetical protein